MSTFIGFAIGVLFGGFLGAVGMYLLIKETAMDRAIEIQELTKIIKVSDKPIKPYCNVGSQELEDPWEAEELPMPEEVKYGEF